MILVEIDSAFASTFNFHKEQHHDDNDDFVGQKSLQHTIY